VVSKGFTGYCLAFALLSALLDWGAAPWARASELDNSSERCIPCHQGRARAHIHDLQYSAHARFGMVCNNCHVPTLPEDASVAHDGRTPACVRPDVIAICGHCHEDVAAAFRTSPHYGHTADSAATPICIDCHSSAGGQIFSDLSKTCGTCHAKTAPANRPWIVERAPRILDLLREVTLARTVVAEEIAAAERGGHRGDALRAEVQALDASVRDIPFEWHRFNLTEAEGRCATALATLERAHRSLNAARAAGKTAAPEDPSGTRSLSLGRELNRPLRPGEKPLRFAVAEMLGPVATYDAYVGLLGDLARSLGRPYRLVQRRTYQEINELLLHGELDLAFVCSGAYAALPADAPVEVVAVPVVAGRSVYHSLIVVHASSTARRFEDLKGARFAFTDPLSNTGYLYPVYRLAQMGTDAADFFSSTLLSGSHDRSILAVQRKLVDAAAVDDLVYNRIVVPGSPYWSQLRVIETSPDLPIPPVVAPTSVPAEDRARYRQFLVTLTDTPEGHARLAALGLDGFVPGLQESYAPVRRMLEGVGAR
jgi:phosphonate transport system substrate-binding protein